MPAALSRDPFDALGDATRRSIVTMLAEGDRTVGSLAAGLPISRPAVSRHLRVLKEAGLVEDRPDGTRRMYRLRQEGLDEVREFLGHVWGEVAMRFTMAAENTTPRTAEESD